MPISHAGRARDVRDGGPDDPGRPLPVRLQLDRGGNPRRRTRAHRPGRDVLGARQARGERAAPARSSRASPASTTRSGSRSCSGCSSSPPTPTRRSGSSCASSPSRCRSASRSALQERVLMLEAFRRVHLVNPALYPLRSLAAAGVIYGVGGGCARLRVPRRVRGGNPDRRRALPAPGRGGAVPHLARESCRDRGLRRAWAERQQGQSRAGLGRRDPHRADPRVRRSAAGNRTAAPARAVTAEASDCS